MRKYTVVGDYNGFLAHIEDARTFAKGDNLPHTLFGLDKPPNILSHTLLGLRVLEVPTRYFKIGRIVHNRDATVLYGDWE
jgi:hypothetical protein